MSSYLYIRKNNVLLFSVCRSHPLYAVADKCFTKSKQNTKSDWYVMTKPDITEGLAELDFQIKEGEKEIKKQREFLTYLKDSEEIWDTLNNIYTVLEPDLDVLKESKKYLEFLLWTADECTYPVDENNNYNYDIVQHCLLEWTID